MKQVALTERAPPHRPPVTALRPRHARGFTLLEVLVVLVLVGLLSGLLIQGFSYVLQLRYRIVDHNQYVQTTSLQQGWFRRLVSGLYPTGDTKQPVLSGDSRGFHGHTLAPLEQDAGTAREMSLEVADRDGYSRLHYRSITGTDWILGEWPDAASRFSYLDNAGAWHDRWPADGEPQNRLPEAIRLDVEGGRHPISWIARIAGRKTPKPPPALPFDQERR